MEPKDLLAAFENHLKSWKEGNRNNYSQGYVEGLEQGLRIVSEFFQSPSSQPILQEAHTLIYGERAELYGDPKENVEDIAGRWSDILGVQVTGQQYILCMVALKMSRLRRTPDHRDSWLDIAGYVGVWDKCKYGHNSN
jgi:hypothetical protein